MVVTLEHGGGSVWIEHIKAYLQTERKDDPKIHKGLQDMLQKILKEGKALTRSSNTVLFYNTLQHTSCAL